MANWCEGTLKVHGEKENIKRFMLEALLCNGGKTQLLIQENAECLMIEIPEGEEPYFYVKGSERNVIGGKEIKWNINKPVLEIKSYMGAWDIDKNALTILSKEYQVNFEILATDECGNFSIDFEVQKGNITKAEYTESPWM